jgi:hypothetical protein
VAVSGSPFSLNLKMRISSLLRDCIMNSWAA